MYYSTSLEERYRSDFSSPWDWDSWSEAKVRDTLHLVANTVEQYGYSTSSFGVGLVSSLDYDTGGPNEVFNTAAQRAHECRQRDPEFLSAVGEYLEGRAVGNILATRPSTSSPGDIEVDLLIWCPKEEDMFRREYDRGRRALRRMQEQANSRIQADIREATRARGDPQSRLTDNPVFKLSKPHPADDPVGWAKHKAAFLAERPSQVPGDLLGVLEKSYEDAARELKELKEASSTSLRKLPQAARRKKPQYEDPKQRKLKFTAQGGLQVDSMPTRSDKAPRRVDRETSESNLFASALRSVAPSTAVPRERVRQTIRLAIEASLKVQLQAQLQQQRELAELWDRERKQRQKAVQKDTEVSATKVAEALGLLPQGMSPDIKQGKIFSGPQARRPRTDTTSVRKVSDYEVEEAISKLGGYEEVWRHLQGMQSRGEIWKAQGADEVDKTKQYKPKGRKYRRFGDL